MRRKKLIVPGLFILLLLIVASYLLSSPRKRLEYVSPSGFISRLEDYDFSARRKDYRLPRTIWDSKVVGLLPKVIRSRVQPPRPYFVVGPLFKGEPVLSCAFSLISAGNPVGGVRVVTADESGNEFDEVAHSSALIGQPK
jgi:hypothetical protein